MLAVIFIIYFIIMSLIYLYLLLTCEEVEVMAVNKNDMEIEALRNTITMKKKYVNEHIDDEDRSKSDRIECEINELENELSKRLKLLKD